MPIPVLVFISISYIVALFLFRAHLKSLSTSCLNAARWVLGLALIAHGGFLISLFIGKGAFIPTNPIDTYLVVTMSLGVVCWMISFRRRLISISIVLLPLLGFAHLFYYFYSPVQAVSVLPSIWLWTHIILMILGEVFFVFAAAVSAVYLIADFRLRHRDAASVFVMAGSLPSLERFMADVLTGGLILLSLGMLMGFVFASEFWSTGWYWDPKILFCILTWAFYFALITLRAYLPKSFRGKRSAALACAGFFVLFFLSAGVEWVFQSQHQNYEINITKVVP